VKYDRDKNPVFILAPHTDDGELGCGGTIARFVDEGYDIYYIAFSSARRSVPAGMPDDVLRSEVRKAIQVLGIPESNLILFDYDVRQFPAHRQEILEDLIRLRFEIQPQLIFCPSTTDIHQDHLTVCQEAVRAFKKQSILGYEEPWNNIVFTTRSFVQLKEEHLLRKIEALSCYESQHHRPYLNEETVRATAILRGSQLEGGFAEAFEVIRWMI
jgi:LmbE family N-acetylglucosaminyl deacetylase